MENVLNHHLLLDFYNSSLLNVSQPDSVKEPGEAANVEPEVKDDNITATPIGIDIMFREGLKRERDIKKQTEESEKAALEILERDMPILEQPNIIDTPRVSPLSSSDSSSSSS